MSEPKRKFPIVLPSEAMRRQPPRYWDDEKLFLRSDDGSMNIISADYSNLKTTFAVCEALKIAKEHDARVLYILSEGAGGFGAMTLLGAMVDWNNTHPDDQISEEWLDDHMHLVEVAPQIVDSADLRRLKREMLDWAPDLIFLDTLGGCVAGKQIGAIEVGTALSASVREFCRVSDECPYTSDVFLIHHLGKDASAGPTGSRYLVNDPDGALELKYDQKGMTLKVRVTKARWLRQRTHVFGVREVLLPHGATTVVTYQLAAGDPKLTPERDRVEEEADEVHEALLRCGAPGALVKQDQLLDQLTAKPEPGENEEQHRLRRDNWRKNRLPALIWRKGKRGGAGAPGPIYGLVSGMTLERPMQPSRPFVFKIPTCQMKGI